MSAYDWQLSAGAPLCVFSDSFYRTVREAIFQQLTKTAPPEQFQAAQESLLRLRDELVQDMPAMHYGSLVGTHRCVNHLFKEARARLRGLEIMQLPPPPPPAPKQQLITREGVVIALEEKLQTSSEETDLGTTEFFVPEQPEHGHLCACRPGHWQEQALRPQNRHAGFPRWDSPGHF
jgi:hypothetical protein